MHCSRPGTTRFVVPEEHVSARIFAVAWRRSVRHTDAPSGLPRVLSCLGRLSCRNTGSQLNGRHPRPMNAYIVLAPGNDTS